MKPEEARKMLKEFQAIPIEEQRVRAREIGEVFRVFVLSDPDEDEFADHMENILLTARMLHIAMAARK